MKKFIILEFGICDLAVIPVRVEPSDKSEMATQLLFGEMMEVHERRKNWLRVRTLSDQYEGWIDAKQMQLISFEKFNDLSTSLPVCSAEKLSSASNEKKQFQILIGSSLPGFTNGNFEINKETFHFTGATVSSFNPDCIPEMAMKFLHAPYLWGGRSVFGADCSGFTNVVFKLAGIKLRRDAWQQSEQGMLISFVDEARPGDLAFFHNDEGRISHVGIILEEKKIIHASGRIRIDTLDHYGIFNEEEKKYTHQLRLIRRVTE